MSKNKKNTRKNPGQQSTAARRLFVIDIENLCGKAILNEDDIHAAQRFVTAEFKPSNHDLIVIGTSHTSNFMNAGMAWRGARQVIGRGHDGADLALLSSIDEYDVESFEEIVIMSGDGIFAEAVDEIASRGVIVTVVSIGCSLSKKLAHVAPRVHLVDECAIAA